MPKRKHKESEEDRRKRKIAKLEKKLEKYRKPEEPDIVQISEEENTISTGRPEHEQVLMDEVLDPEFIPEQNNTDDSDQLPNDVLNALGGASSNEKIYGEPINSQIFKCIQNILIEGLSKEQKEKLIEGLPLPDNCRTLEAPRINNEIIGVLNVSAKNRDNLLQERQQDLGIASGAICRAIHALSQNDASKIDVIKLLGESIRILFNLHHQYTMIRRKLVSPFIDPNINDKLKDNKRSEFLFSELEDSIRTLTAIKRSSTILKPKPAQPSNRQSTKNLYQPPRRLNQGQQFRSLPRGGYQPRQHHQQPYRHQFRPLLRGQGRPHYTNPDRGRARYP